MPFARVACVAAAVWLSATPVSAGVIQSQREALESAFPTAERFERRTFVLTQTQAETVKTLARAPLESRIGALHVAWRGETALGYAWIDVHTVRTMPEALLVALTPAGVVHSVRVLAFYEPQDYLPPDRWRAQFGGRTLDDPIQLKRDVHAVAGATLSARATARAVRLALALHRVLVTGASEPASRGPRESEE